VEDEEVIEFEDAEIACLFWMQVELYRQACRSEREKAIERQAAVTLSTTTTTSATPPAGSSSPGPAERRAASSSANSGESREANASSADDKRKEGTLCSTPSLVCHAHSLTMMGGRRGQCWGMPTEGRIPRRL
jgi:hypothetical protein